MLYRKRANDIRKWISESKKSLLVTGARQVGKTFLIENVLEEEHANFIKLDLIENPELVDILDGTEYKNIDTFISRLKLYSTKELVKGETIVFIDEVQRAKDVITKVKYLVDEGSYKYIFSGSLLGIELNDLRSAPVGYMQTIDMYPMDLEEFLIALNISSDILGLIKEAFENETPIDGVIHNRLMEAVYEYLVIGGMPAAVNEYVESGDFNNVMTVHNSIIPQYKFDFTQYESRERKLRLNNMYDLVPSELNKKNKRYYFNHLNKNYKKDRYEDTMLWLINAGVVIPTYNVTEPRIPLIANEKSNLLKLFMSDVGLLTYLYGRSTMLDILDGNRTMNYGAMFENFVAQELNTHGYDTFYFNSKKMGEIDFVIEYKNNCLPIEVKSGKDYSVHAALDNVMSETNYEIKKAIVFCSDNVQKNDNTIYYPIYMVMCIDEASRQIPKYPRLDLGDLK